jgi:4'-phosphopantetheinyl transferase
VWRVDLEHVPDELTALLSAAEHARAQQMLDERRRRGWMRARAVLRELLGRYLQADPRSLRFSVERNGKPELVDDRDADTRRLTDGPHITPTLPFFNVSHSGSLALYAVSGAGPVGVDVEMARWPRDSRRLDRPAVATRAFGQGDWRIARLDPQAAEREFLREWTRYEAVLKCKGAGVGEGANCGTRPQQFVELDVEALGAAAIVLAAPRCDVRCWDWHT